MTGVAVSFTVEEEQVLANLTHAEEAMGHVIDLLAQDLAEEVRMEAGQYSRSLAAPWKITGIGPTERMVMAPEWWAHILAHGSVAHGPVTADKLVFSVAGEQVFATFVSGITGRHFDEAAINRTAGRADEIIKRVITEATK